jgi:probable phosphoglycerate mutase
MILTIHTDGGSRGNPGKAALGVVFLENRKVLAELKQTIGVATNNEAEYSAFFASLEWMFAQKNLDSFTKIEWKLDSKLVIEQLNKQWKIKEPRMLQLATKCWNLLALLKCPYTISYVPRAENAAADALVNQALDEAAA